MDHSLARNLLQSFRRANNESVKRELFANYVSAVFAADPGAQSLINQMALGAERTVANIPVGHASRAGRADTQTSWLIIEWEKDLARTGNHAIAQLKEYLAGNWRSGEQYEFQLIATDGIHWKFYAPDWSRIGEDILDFGAQFEFRETKSFELSENTVEEFPYFLDASIFISTLKPATLENIAADFGDSSPAFINSRAALVSCIESLATSSELKVAYEQWKSFLSIAYGEYDASPAKFFVHTYLSVFAKLLAYTVLARKKEVFDETTLKGVLFGDEFNKFNVERFVENDFFHWVVKRPFFSKLGPMFRSIQRALANYDLSRVEEDVLKGVYQELIDLDTRHALGEYYTPDWLCQKMVESCSVPIGAKVLDPACGSGSFLRAVVERLKTQHPDASATEISNCIYGIDIHPLSVQIAKTTVLLALGDKISASPKPVALHVYLANSLLVPSGSADLFQSRFTVTVDNRHHEIDVSGVSDSKDFDAAIDVCSQLIVPGTPDLSADRFSELVKPNLPTGAASTLPAELFQVYRSMKQATEDGRNSIWKFVLQNSYKPVFLRGCFDLILGNPPWITYADIRNSSYQSLLKKLAGEYKVTARTQSGMPHLEIAAIFLAHCSSYFLKPGGKSGFVLPRSFLSADQHDKFRRGEVKQVCVDAIWDLEKVAPLFRVPSCVVWSTAATKKRAVNTEFAGLSVSGRLPRAQVGMAVAETSVRFEPTPFRLVEIGSGRKKKKSAFSTNPATVSGTNAYYSKFKQGATILPRAFYFVEPDGNWPSLSQVSGSVVGIVSDGAMLAEAKAPWCIKMRGRIEGRFLFRTAISKSILPFVLNSPPIVALPVETGEANLKLLSTAELFKKTFRNAAKWFGDAEKVYNSRRTARAAENELTMLDRLNYQSGIVAQPSSFSHCVLYTSSAKDANAVVVSPGDFDLPFVCDHKAYWFATESLDEARFVCAFLNSDVANSTIKDFQSRGLLGARDVHKTVLMVPLPKFDGRKAVHCRIASISEECEAIAKDFLRVSGGGNLNVHRLGQLRRQLRLQLRDNLAQLDEAIREAWSMSGGGAVIATQGSGSLL